MDCADLVFRPPVCHHLDAVKNPNTALQQTAEDWIESYEESSGPAMSELVNFVLRVRLLPRCGSGLH